MDPSPAGCTAATPDRLTAYARPFGLFFSETASDERVGFRANSPGVDVGLERMWGPDCLAGLAFAYAHTDIQFSDGLGWGDLSALRLGPYLSLVRNDWFLDTSATYGYHDNRVHRRVTVGSIAEVADASYGANDFSLYLGTGRLWESPGRILSPIVSLQYLYFDQPGFTEHDAPAAGLAMGNHSAHSLRSRVGLESTAANRFRQWTIQRDLAAGWAHEYLAEESLRAMFLGGATRFNTRRAAAYRDSGYLNAGLTLRNQDNVAFACRYTGELSAQGDFHAVDLTVTSKY